MINKYEKKYKLYLSLEKRLNEVEIELRKLPYTPLKEPFQRGWVVYFDLRDDIKNRRDYPEIEEAFGLVHKESHTRDVRLIKRIRMNRVFISLPQKEREKKSWELPHLATIRESTYNTLKPEVQKFFCLDSGQEKWSSFRGSHYWLDIPQYWLIMKTRPYILTPENVERFLEDFVEGILFHVHVREEAVKKHKEAIGEDIPATDAMTMESFEWIDD